MRRLTLASGCAALALVSVAGCGGGSSGTSPSTSSPKGAVAGWMAAYKAKNAADFCKYSYLGSQQAQCTSHVGQLFSQLPLTGTYALGNSTTSGTEALVALTGTFSFGTHHLHNTDDNAGLPSGSTTFAQAYGRVLDSADAIPTLPVVEHGSTWQVNLVGGG